MDIDTIRINHIVSALILHASNEYWNLTIQSINFGRYLKKSKRMFMMSIMMRSMRIMSRAITLHLLTYYT